MSELNESPWPVDLDQVRLWPMEREDGPLLQELFDDLADFRIAVGHRYFGPPMGGERSP
jgi:hypothetical protein